jgi:tetratricopeptide (TPR) repeat protein
MNRTIQLLIYGILAFSQCLTAQKRIADNADLTSLVNICDSLSKNNKHKEALFYVPTLLEKGSKELDIQDTAYAKILSKAGLIHSMNNNREEAKSLFEKSCAILRKKAPNHPDLGQNLHLLGNIWNTYGALDTEKAIEAFTEALKVRKNIFGEKHIKYAQTLTNLSTVYLEEGNLAKSEDLLLQALSIYKESMGENHPHNIIILNNLGNTLYQMGEFEKSLQIHLKTYNLRKEAYGERSTECAHSLLNFGVSYTALKAFDKAEKNYLLALDIYRETVTEKNESYALCLDNLGGMYRDDGKFDKAEPI